MSAHLRCLCISVFIWSCVHFPTWGKRKKLDAWTGHPAAPSSLAGVTVEMKEAYAARESAFRSWVTKDNRVVNGIEFKTFDKPINSGIRHRGVFATKDFAEGAVILEVDESLWLSSARKDLFDKPRFADVKCDGCKEALFLAEELTKVKSGNASEWKPYIETLYSFDTYARFHPLAAPLALLDGFGDLPELSGDGVTTLDHLNAFEEAFKLYAKREHATADWKAARWGLAVALSKRRKFGPKDDPLLIPMAYLFNGGSKAAANVEWWLDPTVRDGRRFLTVSASRDIRKGDEIVEHYGGLSTLRAFQLWGYTSEEPNSDATPLTPDLCKRLLHAVHLHREVEGVAPIIKQVCLECGETSAKSAACNPEIHEDPSDSSDTSGGSDSLSS
eukprot:TRINITY_DN72799_c0_g1_i1.p1 TRINITY_DN72799_c0_g1~~TRINITY_DN72799_c0_g1_i1.p1  ORF type:complete len:429 (-),score=43.75 TRINITY_DN72799_c0_g1_i1:33-1196(-)